MASTERRSGAAGSNRRGRTPARDPGERRNVAASHPEALAEARAALAHHAEACEEWRRTHPTAETAVIRGQRQPGWMINRDEIDRKLRSLGYVE